MVKCIWCNLCAALFNLAADCIQSRRPAVLSSNEVFFLDLSWIIVPLLRSKFCPHCVILSWSEAKLLFPFFLANLVLTVLFLVLLIANPVQHCIFILFSANLVPPWYSWLSVLENLFIDWVTLAFSQQILLTLLLLSEPFSWLTILTPFERNRARCFLLFLVKCCIFSFTLVSFEQTFPFSSYSTVFLSKLSNRDWFSSEPTSPHFIILASSQSLLPRSYSNHHWLRRVIQFYGKKLASKKCKFSLVFTYIVIRLTVEQTLSPSDLFLLGLSNPWLH